MGKSASKKVKMGKATMKHKKMSGGFGESQTVFGFSYSEKNDDKAIAVIDKQTDFNKLIGLVGNDKSKYSVKLLTALKRKLLELNKTTGDLKKKEAELIVISDISKLIVNKNSQSKTTSSELQKVSAHFNKYFQEIYVDDLQLTQDVNGNTLLHKILIDGSISDLNNLIAVASQLKPAVLNTPNNEGLTPFMLAVINPNEHMWIKLYSAFPGSIKIGTTTTKEITLLPVIAPGLPSPTKKVTLPAGLNILHLACFLSQDKIITANLTSGKPFIELCSSLINSKSADGNTPLIYSVKSGDIKPEIIKLLLSKGADVTIKNKEENDAIEIVGSLKTVIESNKTDASEDDLVGITKELSDIDTIIGILRAEFDKKKAGEASSAEAAALEARAREEAAKLEAETKVREEADAAANATKAATELAEYNLAKEAFEKNPDSPIYKEKESVFPADYASYVQDTDFKTKMLPLIEKLKDDIIAQLNTHLPNNQKASKGLYFSNAEYKKKKDELAAKLKQEKAQQSSLQKAENFYNNNKEKMDIFKVPPFNGEPFNIESYNGDNDGYKTKIDEQVNLEEELKAAEARFNSNRTYVEFNNGVKFDKDAYLNDKSTWNLEQEEKEQAKKAAPISTGTSGWAGLVGLGGSKKRKNKKAANKKKNISKKSKK